MSGRVSFGAWTGHGSDGRFQEENLGSLACAYAYVCAGAM